jgi:hypothetical protein
MAIPRSEVLNAVGMKLNLFVGGQSKAGIRLSGTWVGQVNFFGSVDGINFIPLAMTPFPSGTAVNNVTANGNWEVDVLNYLVIRVTVQTLTSGSVVVNMASSIDSSYQDAFLAPSATYFTQSAIGAINALTPTLQANRAQRLASLIISLSAQPAWLTSPNLQVQDGTGGSVIYQMDIPPSGSSGQVFNVPLPLGDSIGTAGRAPGLYSTPGNALVITLANPQGSVKSIINAEVHPA